MNRTAVLCAAVALTTIGGFASANAQSPGPVGVSVRAGLFFPTSSGVSDRGNTWFAFGAQYKLTNINMSDTSMASSLELSLDYFSRNDVSETPILLNYVVRQNNIFGSVGAGVDFARSDGDSTTRFGYQVGIGYQFNEFSQLPLFLEAKFWGTDESRFDGIGVYVGARF